MGLIFGSLFVFTINGMQKDGKKIVHTQKEGHFLLVTFDDDTTSVFNLKSNNVYENATRFAICGTTNFVFIEFSDTQGGLLINTKNNEEYWDVKHFKLLFPRLNTKLMQIDFIDGNLAFVDTQTGFFYSGVAYSVMLEPIGHEHVRFFVIHCRDNGVFVVNMADGSSYEFFSEKYHFEYDGFIYIESESHEALFLAISFNNGESVLINLKSNKAYQGVNTKSIRYLVERKLLFFQLFHDLSFSMHDFESGQTKSVVLPREIEIRGDDLQFSEDMFFYSITEEGVGLLLVDFKNELWFGNIMSYLLVQEENLLVLLSGRDQLRGILLNNGQEIKKFNNVSKFELIEKLNLLKIESKDRKMFLFDLRHKITREYENVVCDECDLSTNGRFVLLRRTDKSRQLVDVYDNEIIKRFAKDRYVHVNENILLYKQSDKGFKILDLTKSFRTFKRCLNIARENEHLTDVVVETE